MIGSYILCAFYYKSRVDVTERKRENSKERFIFLAKPNFDIFSRKRQGKNRNIIS
jgi:hypothetical protein